MKLASLRGNALFRVSSRKLLLERLRVSPEVMQSVLDLENPYVRKWKSKIGDVWLNDEPSVSELPNFRPIDIPHPSLKSLQSRLAKLVSSSPLPDWLFSPAKGRSYVDNAAVHVGSNSFYFLDIENYFPSCKTGAIAGLVLNELECPKDVAYIVTKLVTKDGVLPQGSPCSPIFAFYSKMAMWNSVAEVLFDAGLKFSVYADDLTISGDMIRGETIWHVKKIIHRHGMTIRGDKEGQAIGKPADITGVIVVKDGLRLPNRQFLRLARLRQYRHIAPSDELPQIDMRIGGRLAQQRQIEEHLARLANAHP